MDKIPNEVISIQFRKDYILIETIEGCREIEYIEGGIPNESNDSNINSHRHKVYGSEFNVWIDNLQAIGLSLYEWPDKVKRYGPEK